jgi:hypothetical protein
MQIRTADYDVACRASEYLGWAECHKQYGRGRNNEDVASPELPLDEELRSLHRRIVFLVVARD